MFPESTRSMQVMVLGSSTNHIYVAALNGSTAGNEDLHSFTYLVCCPETPSAMV